MSRRPPLSLRTGSAIEPKTAQYVTVLPTLEWRIELKRKINNRTLLLIIAILFLCNSKSFAGETWFNQQITWEYGKEGLPSKTVIKSPDGEEYLLMLRPLWDLEGGVLALEIVMARPSEPDMNILGQRKKGVASPFVVSVAELEKGLKHSKFGARRTLQADSIVVDARIGHFRFGKGVGSGSLYCAKCKNLRELTMWVTVASEDK